MNARLAATIAKASLDDLPAIKMIADANRAALGFIPRAAIERAIASEEVVVAHIDQRLVGFQTYRHHRRDLDTKLYYKCVDANFRRRGIGTLLVDEVVKESVRQGRRRLVLKCPEDLPSNAFHRHYGFILRTTESGKQRRLNIWELELPHI